MKRVVPVISRKGGPGKTSVARALVDRARAVGVRTDAWDGDGGVGQLLSHYGSRDENGRLLLEQTPSEGVGYFDFHNPKDREHVVNVIDTTAELVVVDLPGGMVGTLGDVVRGGLPSLIETWRDEGWDVTLLQVITPLRACAVEVVDMVRGLEDQASALAVVRNHFWGDEDDFYIFGGSRYGGAQRRVLEAGGKVIDFPKLRSRTYAYVDEFSLPYWAVESFRDPVLPKNEPDGKRGDRKEMRAWLADVAGIFAEAGLLPTAAPVPAGG